MIIDRLWSIGFVLVYALGTLMISATPEVWWSALLVGMAIAGHTHYLLGLWYQYESFGRRSSPFYARTILSATVVCTVFLTYLALILFPDRLVYLMVFIAFLLHAVHNELTALSDNPRFKVSTLHFGPLAGIGIGFFLTTLADSTVFFHKGLVYSEFRPDVGFIEYTIYGYAIAVATAVIGIIWSLWLKDQRFVSLYMVILVIILVMRHYEIVVPFIYFIYATLLYHIIIWFLTYLRKVRVDSARLFTYLIRHGGLLLFFGILAFVHYGTASGHGLMSFAFNIDFFIFTSLVHATTSLLNEPFAQRFLVPRE